MSRSKKNKSGKGPGFEYWGRRPSKMGTSVGKYGGRIVKDHTHKLERRQKSKDVQDQASEMDKD